MLLITDDDETLFASYLCLRHRPHVIVCLRSFRMGERSYPHREFRMDYQTRERETAEAMQLLGCSWEQWDIPDNGDDGATYIQIESRLSLVIDEYEQVFAPAVEENGQYQHNMVGEVAEFLSEGKAVHYLTYTPAGRSRSEHEIPFQPEWPALKLRALACYESQIKHPSTRAHFLDGGLREYLQ